MSSEVFSVMPMLKDSELRVLLVIIRAVCEHGETNPDTGCREAVATYADLRSQAGLNSNTTISNAIKGLLDRDLIQRRPSHEREGAMEAPNLFNLTAKAAVPSPVSGQGEGLPSPVSGQGAGVDTSTGQPSSIYTPLSNEPSKTIESSKASESSKDLKNTLRIKDALLRRMGFSGAMFNKIMCSDVSIGLLQRWLDWVTRGDVSRFDSPLGFAGSQLLRGVEPPVGKMRPGEVVRLGGAGDYRTLGNKDSSRGVAAVIARRRAARQAAGAAG